MEEDKVKVVDERRESYIKNPDFFVDIPRKPDDVITRGYWEVF